MDKETIVKEIQEYLTLLQSGQLGVPTATDLENAGLLHAFIENTQLDAYIGNEFFLICDAVSLPKNGIYSLYGVLEEIADDENKLRDLANYLNKDNCEGAHLHPVMNVYQPDNYIYVDDNHDYVLCAYIQYWG